MTRESAVGRHSVWWRVSGAVVALTFSTWASGCGTLLSGTHQKVVLGMNPPGTELDVYRWSGEKLPSETTAPGTVKVHRPIRHESYLVRLSKDGYCPQYRITTSRPSGGAWTYLWMAFIPALGPILLAVLIGSVDGATGGCCAMSPDTFNGFLAEDVACPE